MKQFNITGMSCAACSARVEKAVMAVEGVSSCAVSLLTNSMGVSGSASADEIIAAVEKAGYGASEKGKKSNKKNETAALGDRETPKLVKRLVFSLVLLAVLMYFSMGHGMWGFPLPAYFSANPMAQGIVQLLLALSVMVINQRFFISGFSALAKRAPNMDTLVALGSSAAFAYSTYQLFGMGEKLMQNDAQGAFHIIHGLYFESAAMILSLITVGKMLEAHSKGKTTIALEGLMRLAPKNARVIRNGTEIDIPCDQLLVGDVFVVYPGDRIPVDGTVESGESSVNEASLTGESLPVDKTVGSTVSSGTLNLSGYLTCRAEKVGEDTVLAQIIKTVSDAAATKAPIAKAADKVSGVFVPFVIAASLLTGGIWLAMGESFGYSLARAISVLVISCPCALGLATPVAIMVGSGVGAKNGILFKTAAALEETGRAKTVILDKTGTITNGTPAVTDIITFGDIDESKLLYLAASLESKSEHPLGVAVVNAAREKGLELCEAEGFVTYSGKGLCGTIEGKNVYGGNLGYISEIAEISSEIIERADLLATEGKTPMFFALGFALIGIIAVADTIREESAAAISELKEMGIQVVMLTGDNKRTALAVGREAGVDEMISEVLPSEKAKAVSEYSARGKTVMVGDGINDAPALTQADVGVAVAQGTDIAIDAADVVLMKSSLRDLPAALRLGRATLRNIYQNLFWAFIYNAIGIPLAAGAFVPFGIELEPMFGAAAMSLSSFCVVTNALRLNLFKLYDHKKVRSKNKDIITEENKKMIITMNVEGMMCPHCEAHVKKALEAIEGVECAQASHEEKSVVITLSAAVPDEKLRSAIEAEGYKVF